MQWRGTAQKTVLRHFFCPGASGSLINVCSHSTCAIKIVKKTNDALADVFQLFCLTLCRIFQFVFQR